MKLDIYNVKEAFLKNAYYVIARQEICASKGEATNDAQKQQYDFLGKLVLQAGSVQEMNAENASDIIKLVSQGKISMPDALRFMQILQAKQDIEELPKIMEKLNQLSDDRALRIT